MYLFLKMRTEKCKKGLNIFLYTYFGYFLAAVVFIKKNYLRFF